MKTSWRAGKNYEVEKPKKLAPVVDLMLALNRAWRNMEGKKKKPAGRGKLADAGESRIRGQSAPGRS